MRISKLPLIKVASNFLLVTFFSVMTIFGNNFNLGFSYSDLPIATANQSKTTYPSNDKQVEGLLYSDSKTVESLNSVDEFVPAEIQKALKDPAQIPAVKQPIIDRSNPENKLLEKTVQMFEDAGNFSAN